MKKVVMNISISSSEDWSYYPGQLVVLDNDRAFAWHNCGHCTILEDAEETTIIQPIEEVEETIVNEQPIEIVEIAKLKSGAKNGNSNK